MISNSKKQLKNNQIHFNSKISKRKQKLITKYGGLIEQAMNKIETEQNLGRFLRIELGSYFYDIIGAWIKYKTREIDKPTLINHCINMLGNKFIDIFIQKSLSVFKERKRNVYLIFLVIFISVYAFCMTYFLILMPEFYPWTKPQGNFIFPGDERQEWIFTMIMAPISLITFSYFASLILPRLTLRIYTKSVKKNQKFGLVTPQHLFGRSLYRKLFFRALVIGLFTYNLSYTLSSQILFVSFMKSVDPTGVNLIPDPELMIQIMWLSVIPCIFIIIPVWLMMDLGLTRTKKIEGVESESVNLAGSKFYKGIKGYAGIGFIYNLVLLISIWISDDVPLIRIIMRVISPILVISFMFPLVVLIDYSNEAFKRKLWEKLKKYEINKKLKIVVEEEPIEKYEEIYDYLI
ncbi:MAG: hypothetical protein ACFFBP_13935 [Promethearchaeota archaeon]